MQEIQVQSLGQEDTLEKEMATQSSLLAWEIYRQRSLAGYSPWGHKTVRHDLTTKQQPLSIQSLSIYYKASQREAPRGHCKCPQVKRTGPRARRRSLGRHHCSRVCPPCGTHPSATGIIHSAS